jgi:hypothetical protein
VSPVTGSKEFERRRSAGRNAASLAEFTDRWDARDAQKKARREEDSGQGGPGIEGDSTRVGVASMKSREG